MSFQGKINVYVCTRKCGNEIITKDRDEGTTPFMTRCERCSPTIFDKFVGMQSQFYRVDQTLTPDHEWYKPTDEEFEDEMKKIKQPESEENTRMIRRAMKTHLNSGGLFLRKIETKE